jgi:hypothetical protein
VSERVLLKLHISLLRTTGEYKQCLPVLPFARYASKVCIFFLALVQKFVCSLVFIFYLDVVAFRLQLFAHV